jgi:hypothetical protein
VNDTPWRNILTNPGCNRTVSISVRDYYKNYAKRYVVTIGDGLWKSRDNFVEFAPLVEQYGLVIGISVKFEVCQEIGLTQGTGHSGLDLECFGQKVRQILLLPAEDRLHTSTLSPPNELVLDGYTTSCHYEKRRIGHVTQQSAKVHADGRIRFLNHIPAAL